MNADPSATEVSIDQLHWKIHKGLLFNVTDTITGSTPVIFMFKVGANTLHSRYLVESGLACTIRLNEDVVVSADGTPETVVNYNRTSANTLLSTVFRGPTITGAGTVLEVDQSGSGTTPGQASAGENFSVIEYVFKANTNYTATLTPASSTTIVFKATMYEAVQA